MSAEIMDFAPKGNRDAAFVFVPQRRRAANPLQPHPAGRISLRGKTS
jgi:hypothetical protein